jgi:tRNA (guanine37-N1)-methyltransferase
MTIVDSVVRLLPGVLGNPESLVEESFNEVPPSPQGLRRAREYPQYTRPEEYKGWKVPEVLLSGNHKLINEWRNHK